MITLESVGAEVAPALAEIHRRGFAPPWTVRDIVGLMEGPGVMALVALADELPAGFVLFRVAADEAEVLTIVTLPDFRRRGVGAVLLDGACDAAARDGAAAIFLEVAIDNDAALALYARGGFREIGERPRYYARPTGDVAAVIMKLDLNR